MSKKRAVEAEREINMDDKVATPVEQIGAILPPVEPNRPAQPENVSLQDIMRLMGEFSETLKNNNKELKEGLNETNKKIDGNSKKMEEKIDDNSKKMEESMETLKEELKQNNQKNLEYLKEELSKAIEKKTTNK